MKWTVKATRKQLDEHLNLIDSDLRVIYHGHSRFIGWIVYKWLTLRSRMFPTVIRTNLPADFMELPTKKEG